MKDLISPLVEKKLILVDGRYNFLKLHLGMQFLRGYLLIFILVAIKKEAKIHEKSPISESQ